MSKIFSYLLFCFGFIYPAIAQQGFVQRKGGQFMLNGQPYYYIGTNYWYGSFLPLLKDKTKGIERLRKELDFLASNGVKNLRVVVGAEGSGQINGVQRIGPALQTGKGVFDVAILTGLDELLAEMGRRNMKAILVVSNNWEWSGGFLQYLNWNGLIPDSVVKRKLSWDEQRDYTSKFYTCQPCMDDYKKQALLILSRTNSITQKKYTNDPAIMAWELANEPRPMRSSSNDAYKKWISETAAFIKSKDKNHLVTTGHEGEMGTESLPLFEEIHADKNIDYLTIHIWPKNWSWFKDTAVQSGLAGVINQTNSYIQKHTAVAKRLNKPLVLEEFGLPRNGHSFDVTSSTTARDAYYKNILSIWKGSAINNDVIAGANFWAFGGSARPVKNQIFWKAGDDYMGDPPMEEQGLNTVFDSDTSTWRVLRSYSIEGAKLPGTSLNNSLVDPLATAETVNLYNNLKRLLAKGIMFGHQDDLAYGVNWKYQKGRSDVKEVTGDYPAVYGWELGGLETDQTVNIDSVPFDKMKGFIRQAYDRGGIVTVSWHFKNPLTGKTAWDPAPGTVASILSGGAKHELYKTWLDKLAGFMQSLQGKNGEAIPVIFRPLHELNGNWFWWGKAHCTPGELKQLWQFTVTYLRDVKGVHNLLYAFNTDRFSGTAEYLERFPGDEWADVLGVDVYQKEKGPNANEKFVKEVSKMLFDLEEIAKQKNKIPAMTEFGFGGLPDSTWWTTTFWKAIQSHKISYVLGWRNAGRKANGSSEFYVPFRGHDSAPDFLKFYAAKGTLFQKEVARENLYKTP